ncbi:HNH endonuclease signature motif containing protein [uncultured Microbacterium sp.]|uniref:HNH endonuclease n=1 Tax=uncultured Microbacterium sp. TaxID=191216 RepID=UPI0025DF3F17|nr:HNH endonuclease signature motif containing protein [uncultured Microbacterium sp.]
MTRSDPPPPSDDPPERARLRAHVDDIGRLTAELARVQATLIRRRAEAMSIALDQVARSRSRASREREMPIRSLALEIGVATRTHDLTVQKELSDAHTLTQKFAATVEALHSGRIGLRHAHAILETGVVLDDDATRRGWESVVLVRAKRDSPGRVRAFARELAESVHPMGMSVRHARAAEARGVSVRDLADGMAELSVILPATVAYGIRDRLRRQAAAIREATIGDAVARADDTGRTETNGAMSPAPAPSASRTSPLESTLDSAGELPHPDAGEPAVVEDSRTLAQIGADVCADLLLTGTPAIDPTTRESCPGGLGAIRGHVQITVPVLTLMGRSDAGASLEGRCPVDATTARALAGSAVGWDRVLCEPVTGTVLEVDRYAPTSSQRRFLAARDRHCRAPGCRAPAARCQIDHNHEAQHGGRTHLCNLCHFCVRHHTLKTETEWTVVQERDGTLHFRSPLGQRMREEPPPRVMFLPDDILQKERAGAAPPF